MIRLYCLVYLISLAFPRLPALQTGPTQTPGEIALQSPGPGQAIQGNVTILGDTDLPGFQSAELSFAYPDDPSQTWFLIAGNDQPVTNGVLAQWDTTVITDGIYNLRLKVTLEDGSQKTALVSGVRVRNYTPVETETPAPAAQIATSAPGNAQVPTITLTPTIPPVPATYTPLPTNPAELTSQQMALSLGKGALATLGLFAFAGLYASLHWLRRRQ